MSSCLFRLSVSAGLVAGLVPAAQPAFGVDGARTFAVFDSSGMNRVVHGRERDVKLSAGPVGFGGASAFFGVDALSNDASHYLSSGVEWRSGHKNESSLLRIGAMHTAARGSRIGSQTLMRAESQLELGDRWYVPALSLETDQLSASSGAAARAGGRATHLGLSNDGAYGSYRMGYFHASTDFSAWGSSLAPGDRGMELAGQYELGGRWQLSNTLRLHHDEIATGTAGGLVDRWALAGRRSIERPGDPWRLSGQIGSAGVSDAVGPTPMALRFAAPTRHWRDWRLDSSLGWYRGGIATPGGLPIAGGVWRVSMDRAIEIAGIRTRLRPSLAVGGSRHDDRSLGSRAGLGVVFPGVFDHMALHMDYASRGWSATPGRRDVRMSLNFSQNASGVISPLRSFVDRLY